MDAVNVRGLCFILWKCKAAAVIARGGGEEQNDYHHVTGTAKNFTFSTSRPELSRRIAKPFLNGHPFACIVHAFTTRLEPLILPSLPSLPLGTLSFHPTFVSRGCID